MTDCLLNQVYTYGLLFICYDIFHGIHGRKELNFLFCMVGMDIDLSFENG